MIQISIITEKRYEKIAIKRENRNQKHRVIWIGTAHIHTYDSLYDYENFSDADKKNAIKRQVPNYVLTPKSLVKKYKIASDWQEILVDTPGLFPHHPKA